MFSYISRSVQGHACGAAALSAVLPLQAYFDVCQSYDRLEAILEALPHVHRSKPYLAKGVE